MTVFDLGWPQKWAQPFNLLGSCLTEELNRSEYAVFSGQTPNKNADTGNIQDEGQDLRNDDFPASAKDCNHSRQIAGV
jgi:hypothetical protein